MTSKRAAVAACLSMEAMTISVDVIPAGMRLQRCQLLSWWRTPIQRRIKDKDGWRRTAYLFAFLSIVSYLIARLSHKGTVAMIQIATVLFNYSL